MSDHFVETESKIGLKVVNLDEFLEMELPPRENILKPWLPKQGLVMIHAPRGIGKTLVALNIAYAVASGGEFLGWEAAVPRGVLFVDGEMPANVLQERIAAIVAGADKEKQACLKIITPDLQEYAIPDLATPDGQAELNEEITDEIDLIILDNLSALVRSGKENEAESWQPIQDWALSQRAGGRSVLFIHHSGKRGAQRGTSRREDCLDTVIALRHSPDYSPSEGALFEVHFEKARGIYGSDVKPFEAKLTENEHGEQLWVVTPLDQSNLKKVAALLSEGLSQKEIGIELALSKGYVSKLARQAREDGMVVS